ncbi:hypothetical protein HYC85_019118 [Camellia sinensis]|uniref:Uncharacterized protein n=1 Tax=Camellia sinensis TaxID=4442 RepID=A0A7J7GPV2_CAMSI|nr:hypothetical protein HYC85_019118 [Camellia sinensis]
MLPSINKTSGSIIGNYLNPVSFSRTTIKDNVANIHQACGNLDFDILDSTLDEGTALEMLDALIKEKLIDLGYGYEVDMIPSFGNTEEEGHMLLRFTLDEGNDCDVNLDFVVLDSTLDEGPMLEMLDALKERKLFSAEREREGDVNLDFDFLDSTLDEGAMLDALKEGNCLVIYDDINSIGIDSTLDEGTALKMLDALIKEGFESKREKSRNLTCQNKGRN